VSLTQGKEHHEFRAHYIVTNTHPLGYPRRCDTFQDVLFSSPKRWILLQMTSIVPWQRPSGSDHNQNVVLGLLHS